MRQQDVETKPACSMPGEGGQSTGSIAKVNGFGLTALQATGPGGKIDRAESLILCGIDAKESFPATRFW